MAELRYLECTLVVQENSEEDKELRQQFKEGRRIESPDPFIDFSGGYCIVHECNILRDGKVAYEIMYVGI